MRRKSSRQKKGQPTSKTIQKITPFLWFGEVTPKPQRRDFVCGELRLSGRGVSWQVAPSDLGELPTSGDAATSQRVMNALMQMIKLEIDTLRNA